MSHTPFYLNKLAEHLAANEAFARTYADYGLKKTYGQRRSMIRSALWDLFQARSDVYDGEQLRRYFDALYAIPSDPNDSTFSKYAEYPDTLDMPTSKKGNSVMDKNLAALLRADAKTVYVKFTFQTDDGSARRTRAHTHTYVSHLNLASGDSVVVDSAGRTVIGVVDSIDDEAKIEPGCDIEYKWVIAKIDMAAYEANMKRNEDIVAEAAVIVRNNMRKSFAAQVLGAASEEQRNKLLRLTGNATA